MEIEHTKRNHEYEISLGVKRGLGPYKLRIPGIASGRRLPGAGASLAQPGVGGEGICLETLTAVLEDNCTQEEPP